MAAAAGNYADHKRGEVNELKGLLNNPRLQKDAAKYRDVIKKVIAYMTLGIDVSRLFNEMLMASSTKDLVQKKMVYLYLCTYAEQKSDLAIMAINTLHKDCRDEDPMVRGLALRSLCSLRLPNIVEYVLQPIRQRLNDPSPYVRKTAVIGVAKLFQRVPAAVKESDLIDVLYNMLRDKDPQVVTNAVVALNEILLDEGGMAINRQIVMHLLNRLHEFNEWGQCIVLEVVAKYKPASDEEMFDVMNLLEDRLQHANCAVVLAATKVFLNFTSGAAEVHLKVYERLKVPLVTLMTGGSWELAYTVLSHIDVLVRRAPGVFDDQYKHFFARFNDPPCVKLLKLSVLERLANNRSFHDILAECTEYVTDVDADVARKAIRAVSAIALRIDAAADESIEALLGFLELNSDYVTAETCIVLKDLLRKYPERYEEVVPALHKVLKMIEEEEGKVAVIWMIGEYGDTIKDAPYILEPLVDAFDDEPSHAVRLELLAAAMKLFFKRPPELKAMLGRLLAKALHDTSQIDVRDRALLYYRLLRYDVHEAARVVNCPKVIVELFVEEEDKELSDLVFQEFNSLSVTYRKPASLFVTGVQLQESEEQPVLHDEPTATTALTAGAEDIEEKESDTGSQAKSQVDVLPIDVLNIDGSEVEQPTLRLKPNPVVNPATFQEQWGVLRPAEQLQLAVITPSQNAAQIEKLLERRCINTMASGTQAGVSKFYFYAQNAADDSFFFVEAVLDLGSGQMRVSIKSPGPGSDAFSKLFQDALKPIIAAELVPQSLF